jgi:hypothetical protein
VSLTLHGASQDIEYAGGGSLSKAVINGYQATQPPSTKNMWALTSEERGEAR